MSYVWTAENPLIDGTDYPQAAMINEIRNILDHQSNYWCSVYLNGAQSIPNAADTLINHDTIVNDPNSNFSVSTHKYTVPLTGTYLITAIIGFAIASPLSPEIWKNGSQFALYDATTQDGAPISIQVQLTAADLIDIRVYQASGGSRALSNAQSRTNLQIQYLHS